MTNFEKWKNLKTLTAGFYIFIEILSTEMRKLRLVMGKEFLTTEEFSLYRSAEIFCRLNLIRRISMQEFYNDGFLGNFAYGKRAPRKRCSSARRFFGGRKS